MTKSPKYNMIVINVDREFKQRVVKQAEKNKLSVSSYCRTILAKEVQNEEN